MTRDALDNWLAALEKRHYAELTFQEVRKGLQAVSAIYVQKRDKLAGGAVFDGRGKRAAFAIFYGPLHFVAIRAVIRELGAADPPPSAGGPPLGPSARISASSALSRAARSAASSAATSAAIRRRSRCRRATYSGSTTRKMSMLATVTSASTAKPP